jgi:hypothetical protein
LGIPITYICETHLPFRIFFFSLLTCAHLYCSYRALLSVHVRNLNLQRSVILMNHYLNSLHSDCVLNGSVHLTPGDVSEKEDFLHSYSLRSEKQIILGSDLTTATSVDGLQLRHALEMFSSRNYFLVSSPSPSPSTSSPLHIFFKNRHTPHDRFESLFIGMIYDQLRTDSIRESRKLSDIEMIQGSLNMSDRLFPHFCEQLKERGWEMNFESIELESENYYDWEYE